MVVKIYPTQVQFFSESCQKLSLNTAEQHSCFTIALFEHGNWFRKILSKSTLIWFCQLWLLQDWKNFADFSVRPTSEIYSIKKIKYFVKYIKNASLYSSLFYTISIETFDFLS